MPLSRLSLLMGPSVPPAVVPQQSIPYRPQPRPSGPGAIASVRSCSYLSFPARVSPNFNPSYPPTPLQSEDPTTHPAFSLLPRLSRIVFFLLAWFHLGAARLSGTFPTDDTLRRRGGATVLVLGLILGPLLMIPSGTGGSAPGPAEPPVQSSSSRAAPAWVDSVRSTLPLARLRSLKRSVLHYPARPPVPDSLLEVSSGFGPRWHPVTGRSDHHTGVDLAVPQGTPVRPPGKGVVTAVGVDSLNGRYLRIDHDPLGYVSTLAHLRRLAVRPGDTVRVGQTVATAGQTGRATGPHLHFEVRRSGQPVDPSDLYREYRALRDRFDRNAQRMDRRLRRAVRRARSAPDTAEVPAEVHLARLRGRLREQMTLPPAR